MAEHHSAGDLDQRGHRAAAKHGLHLVGALFVIPFILGYTAMSYYVFRGNVGAGEGYH